MKTLFSVVIDAAKLVKNGRSPLDIYRHTGSEYRELGLEIVGRGDGKDGVIGEAIDMIICDIDQIYLENPEITEAEVIAIAERKCEKWKAVYKDRPGKFDDNTEISDDAHELWALAQTLPNQGIEDAAARIESFLRERDDRIHQRKTEALQNVLGFLDTPVGRRRHANDQFYDDTIKSVKTAL